MVVRVLQNGSAEGFVWEPKACFPVAVGACLRKRTEKWVQTCSDNLHQCFVGCRPDSAASAIDVVVDVTGAANCSGRHRWMSEAWLSGPQSGQLARVPEPSEPFTKAVGVSDGNRRKVLGLEVRGVGRSRDPFRQRLVRRISIKRRL